MHGTFARASVTPQATFSTAWAPLCIQSTVETVKEALLAAATRVGFIRENDILDKDGKSTGKTELKWDGDGGLEGYLEWAAVYHPGHFIPQLGRVMPLQVNVKAETPKRPKWTCRDRCSRQPNANARSIPRQHTGRSLRGRSSSPAV